MSPNRRVEIFPNDFLVPGDLEKLGHVSLSLAVTANQGVAIGQALSTARISKATINMRIINPPGNLARGVELHRLIPVGQVDQKVSPLELNGGEWPISRLASAQLLEIGPDRPHDCPVRFVLLDRKSEQVRDDIISVGKLACHPGLHVAVLCLWLERNGHRDRTVLAHFQELGLNPPFHDQGVPIVKTNARTKFLVSLAQLIAPDDLPFPGNLFGLVTYGDQNVSRLKNESVPAIALRLPDDLVLLIH